jgi:hypothetical protein
MTKRFLFTADLWEHEGDGAWHFISLPEDQADEIEELYGRNARGFGSLRVTVTVGATQWSTSIFPDKKRATYVLPVKHAVRKAESLTAGSKVRVDLVVIQ